MNWVVLDHERAILALEYSFRPGAFATALVFRGPEGLVVISPPSGIGDEDFEALAPYGDVVALVANNSGHHLGQGAWRARFPAAKSYAAAVNLEALTKKCGFPYLDVATLELGSAGAVHVLDGFKQGELLVSAAGTAGSVWYTGDLLTNMQKLPGPPLRWLFTWSGSAPGFRIFRLGIWFFVNDKQILRAHLTRLLEQDPPLAVVPGHGPPVVEGDVAGQVRTQLQTL